jgi:hypothetical protein
MLTSPVDLAMIAVAVILVFGGPKYMPPRGGKPETWEKNRHSPRDPFAIEKPELFITRHHDDNRFS